MIALFATMLVMTLLAAVCWWLVFGVRVMGRRGWSPEKVVRFNWLVIPLALVLIVLFGLSIH